MTFWIGTLSNFLANLLAGVLLVIGYVIVQWFLAVTDIVISYNWRFDGTPDAPRNLRPNFDIRNRSRSKSYFLGNVVYRDHRPAPHFDNESIWGKELKPGSIEFVEAAPVAGVVTLAQGLETQVHVQLQNGRTFWLKGTGPGQLRVGRFQRIAFWLRKKLGTSAFPME